MRLRAGRKVPGATPSRIRGKRHKAKGKTATVPPTKQAPDLVGGPRCGAKFLKHLANRGSCFREGGHPAIGSLRHNGQWRRLFAAHLDPAVEDLPAVRAVDVDQPAPGREGR